MLAPDIAFARTDLGTRLQSIVAGRPGANRTIAEFLLRNPIQISAWSIETLALRAGVSAASLTRFARTLGFAGYPGLRAALAETLSDSLLPVEKLRKTFQRGSRHDAYEEGLRSTLDNVRQATEALKTIDLRALVARMAGARSVYVMGFGLSAHLAGLLTLHLQPFFEHLVNVAEFGGTEVAAGRLVNLDERDMLIAISFPRYARDVVDLTRFARDRGAHIVALTDSPASPLAPLGTTLLAVPSTHPVMPSSFAASLVLVEALVSAFMLSKTENVARAAELTGAIANYLFRDDGSGRAR